MFFLYHFLQLFSCCFAAHSVHEPLYTFALKRKHERMATDKKLSLREKQVSLTW